MADEPESDGDGPEGADEPEGVDESRDGEPRPSAADADGDGSDDARSGSGDGGSEGTDGADDADDEPIGGVYNSDIGGPYFDSDDSDDSDDLEDPDSRTDDESDQEPERLPGYEWDDGDGEGDGDGESGPAVDADDRGVDADGHEGEEHEPAPHREYDEPELDAEFEGESSDSPDPADPSTAADETDSGDATGAPAPDRSPEAETETGGERETEAAGAPAPPVPSTSEEVTETDGAGATGASTPPEDDWVEDDWDDDWADSGIVGEGPESDEEMPLADHIEEMVKRLGVVLLIGMGVSLAVFGIGEVSSVVPSAIEIVEYLWSRQIPTPMENRPHVYSPLELLLTQLKVAGLTGVVVGLPVFVYETYLFMRPGLYQNERRYYLAAVPTSLVLGLLGVLFAHFLILPQLFDYFTYYTDSAGPTTIAYGLSDTFTLILVMMGYMAVIFQIPLFIMLAIMMGLTTREWMAERRLLFWGAFLGLSFTFVAVDPTGMAPIVIAVTMVVLFEATLALLRWTGN